MDGKRKKHLSEDEFRETVARDYNFQLHFELPDEAYTFREDCKCLVCGQQRVAYLRLEFVGGGIVREVWQCAACASKGPFRIREDQS